MVFSDQVFCFLFLPIALLFCLALSKTRAFNVAVLVVSLIFFYWGSGLWTAILLFSIFLNYAGGLAIRRWHFRSVLFTLMLLNLGVLFIFKYADFGLGTVGYFGSPTLKNFIGGLLLPIGISFYTFQGVSYIIDVWRGDVKPEPNIITFAAYKTFFPQLIAGPIVRYVDVYHDFQNPKPSLDYFAAGAARFMLGLCKKVLVADMVAPIASAAFNGGSDLTFATAWIGAIAFTIQIYFDFSGYSDMAIGIAMMLGIRFRENFNHPYAAATITEFWRRWHISLSSWFRDYLYIPLGGNRQGSGRTYFNLLIVFLATGIWHGAAWTFVLWGLYNGFFLIVERYFRFGGETSLATRLLYFFPVTIVGWTLFQAPDLSVFAALLTELASPLGNHAFDVSSAMTVALSPQSLSALLIGCIALLLQDRLPALGPSIIDTVLERRPQAILVAAATAGAAIACTVFILPQNFSPFLYFRF